MKKHALMIDTLLVICAVIFSYLFFISPKTKEQRAEEAMRKSNEAIWFETAAYHFMLFYGRSPIGGNDALIDRIKHINGRRMQLLRFCCWLTEEDRNRRAKLIRQWMDIMKSDDELPPLPDVKERIYGLIKGKPVYDVAHRLSEIEVNYPVASDPNMVYSNQEHALASEMFHPEDLFIDKDEPLGLAIFNEKKKSSALEEFYKAVKGKDFPRDVEENVLFKMIRIIR